MIRRFSLLIIVIASNYTLYTYTCPEVSSLQSLYTCIKRTSCIFNGEIDKILQYKNDQRKMTTNFILKTLLLHVKTVF